jgi:hypothetical protein
LLGVLFLGVFGGVCGLFWGGGGYSLSWFDFFLLFL